jgi:hypothetical protein
MHAPTGRRLLNLERAFDEGYRHLMDEPPSSQSMMTDEMEELVQLQEQHRSIISADATPPEDSQQNSPHAKNTSNRVLVLPVIPRARYSLDCASPRTVTGSPTLRSTRLHWSPTLDKTVWTPRPFSKATFKL